MSRLLRVVSSWEMLAAMLRRLFFVGHPERSICESKCAVEGALISSATQPFESRKKLEVLRLRDFVASLRMTNEKNATLRSTSRSHTPRFVV